MDKKTILKAVTIGCTILGAIASVAATVASGMKAEIELAEKVQEAVAK